MTRGEDAAAAKRLRALEADAARQAQTIVCLVQVHREAGVDDGTELSMSVKLFPMSKAERLSLADVLIRTAADIRGQV